MFPCKMGHSLRSLTSQGFQQEFHNSQEINVNTFAKLILEIHSRISGNTPKRVTSEQSWEK